MKYLIPADGKLANLAMMRLGTYWRERGEEVRLVRGLTPRTFDDPPGDVFGSSIFSFSAERRRWFDRHWGPVCWGGTGVRIESNLSEIDPSVDWEAVQPDYSLYPGFRASLGFLFRGCTLRCPWCVVPKKEGLPRQVKSPRTLWRGAPHPKLLHLLDNDFFGAPGWQDAIVEIREDGFKVCFSQGINIRQITEEAGAALASIEYRNNEFNERVLYTAWDSLGDERRFKQGVATLAAAGVPPKHLRVYMLVGYSPGETLDAILYRFHEMVALGCEPYPMVYDPPRGVVPRDRLKDFQRWAVTGLYRRVPWVDYSRTHRRVDRTDRYSLPLFADPKETP